MVNIWCWALAIQSTCTIDYMEFLTRLNLGLQGGNPLLLPSNHLIWYETNGVMIGFIMLLIPNVLQKSNLTIIIFLILCPNQRILTSFYKTSKMYTFLIFLRIYIYIYIIWLIESCNLIHFNNGVLKIFFQTITIFLIFCPNEKN